MWSAQSFSMYAIITQKTKPSALCGAPPRKDRCAWGSDGMEWVRISKESMLRIQNRPTHQFANCPITSVVLLNGMKISDAVILTGCYDGFNINVIRYINTLHTNLFEIEWNWVGDGDGNVNIDTGRASIHRSSIISWVHPLYGISSPCTSVLPIAGSTQCFIRWMNVNDERWHGQ